MKTTIVAFAVIIGVKVLLSDPVARSEDSTIQVLRANYSTHYGDYDECNKVNGTDGDYTELLKAECNGKSNCSYGKIGEKGDHCPDKRKGFDYFWTCTSRSGQTEKEGHITPEASGKVANLSCP